MKFKFNSMNKLFQQLCICVVLLSITQTVVAQMSGTYTVGSDGDYATISDAIADINSQGLSGDVTLNIASGFYPERIDLSNLNNGGFTVTLDGGNKETTTISPPNQDAASIKAGIVIQNTSNVVLRNMRFSLSEITDNTSSTTYGIYVENASNVTVEESILINSTVVIDNEYEIRSSMYLYNTNDVQISSNQFEGAQRHIEFDYFTDLTISGNTFDNALRSILYEQSDLGGDTGSPGNNLTVKNNTFTTGVGIQTSAVSSSIDPRPSNLLIDNNDFNGQETYAIRIFGYDMVDVVGNTIVSDVSNATGVTGISVNANSGGSISNNIIHLEKGVGIDLSRADDVKVYNNIVSCSIYPMELFNVTNTEVVHNTLHSEDDNAGTSNNVLLIEGGSENLTLVNNMFSAAVGPGADGNSAIDIQNVNTNLVMDHNLYDADATFAISGLSGSTEVNGVTTFGDFSLTDWSNLVGLDQNSQSLSPVFTNATDFRIGSADFRFGTFLSEYDTDIDGEIRVEGSVDIGSDQYCVAFEVSESISSCETYEFDGLTLTESGEFFGEFVATNGCDSLVTLNLTILEPTTGSDDVTAEGSYDWNGTIYSESGSYQQTLTNHAGCDSVATLNLTIEPYFLEGSFIIGSSAEADFSNFTEALAELQHATLTGDVEYTVEVGTYNETLKVSEINSNNHSISFLGEDKSTTILHPMESIDESGAGILIDGTNKVTIQNLTLEMDDISDIQVARNSVDTKGISIADADAITIDNIDLKNDSESSDYNSGTFYIATTLYLDNVNELTVSNCSFSGAGNHITLGVYSSVEVLGNTFLSAYQAIRNTETGSSLLIENNELTGPFETGINLVEIEDVSVLSNVIDGVDQTASSEGIYIDLTNGSTVWGNTVTNVETGIYFRESNAGEISRNEVFFTSIRALYLRDAEDLSVTNNFLGDLVYVRESIALDFVHNTVVVSSDRNNAVLVEYPSSLSGVAHTFINNIIMGGDQVENLVDIVDLTDPSVLTLDHSLYFLEDHSLSGTTTYLINFNGTGDSALTDWQNGQSFTSFDQNSQSFEPSFVSMDDFHITNDTDYRFGTFFADYATDIDGETRLEGSVDVGADQFCTTVEVSESIEACESFEFDGLTLTESGEYFGKFVATNGCDSLVTLSLTVIQKPVATIEVNGVRLLANDIDGAIYQWFDCDTNEPIAEANQRQWTPSQTGEYFVEVTSGVCSAQSDCISYVVVTSVEDQLDRQVSVYPNPSLGRVNIDLTNNLTRLASIEVADLTGRVYQVRFEQQQDTMIIELPENAGVYLITIRSEGGLPYTTRVIRK